MLRVARPRTRRGAREINPDGLSALPVASRSATAGGRRRSTPAALVLLVLGSLLTLVTLTGRAEAAPRLVSSSPPDGSVVRGPVSDVVFAFDIALARLGTYTTRNGVAVATEVPRRGPSPREATLTISGGAGLWHIDWEATALDGTTARGAVQFEIIGDDSPSASQTATAATTEQAVDPRVLPDPTTATEPATAPATTRVLAPLPAAVATVATTLTTAAPVRPTTTVPPSIRPTTTRRPSTTRASTTNSTATSSTTAASASASGAGSTASASTARSAATTTTQVSSTSATPTALRTTPTVPTIADLTSTTAPRTTTPRATTPITTTPITTTTPSTTTTRVRHTTAATTTQRTTTSPSTTPITELSADSPVDSSPAATGPTTTTAAVPFPTDPPTATILELPLLPIAGGAVSTLPIQSPEEAAKSIVAEILGETVPPTTAPTVSPTQGSAVRGSTVRVDATSLSADQPNTVTGPSTGSDRSLRALARALAGALAIIALLGALATLIARPTRVALRRALGLLWIAITALVAGLWGWRLLHPTVGAAPRTLALVALGAATAAALWRLIAARNSARGFVAPKHGSPTRAVRDMLLLEAAFGVLIVTLALAAFAR